MVRYYLKLSDTLAEKSKADMKTPSDFVKDKISIAVQMCFIDVEPMCIFSFVCAPVIYKYRGSMSLQQHCLNGDSLQCQAHWTLSSKKVTQIQTRKGFVYQGARWWVQSPAPKKEGKHESRLYSILNETVIFFQWSKEIGITSSPTFFVHSAQCRKTFRTWLIGGKNCPFNVLKNRFLHT